MSSNPIEEARQPKPESTSGMGLIGIVTILLSLILLVSLARNYSLQPAAPPLSALAATQPTLAKMVAADQLYHQNCAICHGANGEGNGPAAPIMEIPPRNFAGLYRLDPDSGKVVFHAAKYRFVTSKNGAPFKEDIVRTIRHGLAGTSMVSSADLTDQQVDELADYVLEISRVNLRRVLVEQFADQRASKKTQEDFDKYIDDKVNDAFAPEEKMAPAVEPSGFTDSDLLAARDSFAKNCAACHGVDGKGMTNSEWKTEEGQPIASRNFQNGIFKAGGRGKDIYARIYAGIPGTPMPSFVAVLPDKKIWLLTHYVQRMASPDGQDADVFKIKIAVTETRACALVAC